MLSALANQLSPYGLTQVTGALPGELSVSGMCQCDPLAPKPPKTHVVV